MSEMYQKDVEYRSDRTHYIYDSEICVVLSRTDDEQSYIISILPSATYPQNIKRALSIVKISVQRERQIEHLSIVLQNSLR